MSKKNIVELVADSVWFSSRNDEAAFFEWINKLLCLEKIEGRGTEILIYINTLSINENDLRELLSLFSRYNIQMSQLLIFNDDRFAHWFRKESAYWYPFVFGITRNSD